MGSQRLDFEEVARICKALTRGGGCTEKRELQRQGERPENASIKLV